MSAPIRESSPGLIAHLLATPEAFEFVQALRLLRIAASRGGTGAPVPEPAEPANAASSSRDVAVPEDAAPSPARMIANPSLAYPPAELARAERDAADGLDLPALALNFLGLHGPCGVLPAYVTQAVAGGGRDVALTQVLDFFNDRIARAFARVAEAGSISLIVEEHRLSGPGGRESPDHLTRLLLHLAGMGPLSEAKVGGDREVWTRTKLEDAAIGRFYAAAWRCRPMPLPSLQSILRALLRVPVVVLPFELVRAEVETFSRLRLGGQGSGPPGRVLGYRASQAQWGVLVRVGPLDHSTFKRLLPGQRLLRRVGQVVRAALGPWSDYVVQPILNRSQVPVWRLGDPIDDAEQERYWRANYDRQDYYLADCTFDRDYLPAYRYGWMWWKRRRESGRTVTEFKALEYELGRDWEGVKGQSLLTWDLARHAAGDAWERINRAPARGRLADGTVVPAPRLGRSVFLGRKPLDHDFDRLKIGSAAIRRADARRPHDRPV